MNRVAPPRSGTSAKRLAERPGWTGTTWLQYTVRHEDGATVLVLRGDVDFDARDALASLAAELAVAPGPLRVDLSAVDFLDSTGVAFLARVRRHRAERNEQLVVVGAQPLPARVLKVCGFRGLLGRDAGV